MFWAVRIQDALRKLRATLKRGWIREVEEAAHHAPGYLTKVFSGERKPDVETLMALLDHKEVDAEEFLGEVGLAIEFSPRSYLARIPGQGCYDPLLVQLELAASRVSVDAKADPTLLADLHTLDALRFSDVDAAAQQLAELVSACTESRSPEVMHRALSSYAEDRRLHMSFGLAARALTRALEIPFILCREVPVTLQRTSYLLANHDWLRAAERCAKEACDLCVQMDYREGIGKMLYTRAIMIYRQGDTSAIDLYRSSLGVSERHRLDPPVWCTFGDRVVLFPVGALRRSSAGAGSGQDHTPYSNRYQLASRILAPGNCLPPLGTTTGSRAVSTRSL